jgi:lysozyme
MQTSEFGREIIEAFEGCMKAIPGRALYTTYRDSVGVLTIGYGHTNLGNVYPHIVSGVVWTHDQCDEALTTDLAAMQAAVIAIMAGYTLTQDQLDALVSFEFNTGDLAKSSIPAKLKAGDVDAAMDTLKLYNHAGGSILSGLTRRRLCEVALFKGDRATAAKLADIHTASGDAMAKADPNQEAKAA